MNRDRYHVYSIRKNGKKLYHFSTSDYSKVDRFIKDNPTLTVYYEKGA